MDTSRFKKNLSSTGQSLYRSGQDQLDRNSSQTITPVKYKRGGKVRKTGAAIVHKGERVIPRGKVKRVERMMKRSGMRMRSRR